MVEFNKHLFRKAHGAFCIPTCCTKKTYHVLDALTRQGWIAMDILPLAFMLRLPQQAYDARQDAAM